MSGIQLLSPVALAAIKVALANTMATFAVEPVVIHKRSVSVTNFGEDTEAPYTPHPINALYAYTKAHQGKYDIVGRTDKGNEEHDGFRLFLWQDDMTAAGFDSLDSEVDRVVFKGKTYVLNFAAPSAQFSNLGNLLWEVEIIFNHRED